MIILDCEQRSQEWFDARCGIPTASEFKSIITPKKCQLSKSAIPYRNKLLGEWLTGHVDDTQRPDTYWMQRGTELEGEAVDYYEMVQGVKLTRPGLVYRDEERLVSCSPDAAEEDIETDDERTGVEIKCPSPGKHMGYLLGTEDPAVEYGPQIQGSMWMLGKQTWQFLSYHPEMPPVLKTVERTEFADALGQAVEMFLADLVAHREILVERGYKS